MASPPAGSQSTRPRRRKSSDACARVRRRSTQRSPKDVLTTPVPRHSNPSSTLRRRPGRCRQSTQGRCFVCSFYGQPHDHLWRPPRRSTKSDVRSDLPFFLADLFDHRLDRWKKRNLRSLTQYVINRKWRRADKALEAKEKRDRAGSSLSGVWETLHLVQCGRYRSRQRRRWAANQRRQLSAVVEQGALRRSDVPGCECLRQPLRQSETS